MMEISHAENRSASLAATNGSITTPAQPAASSNATATPAGTKPAAPLSGGQRATSFSIFHQDQDNANLSVDSFTDMVAAKTQAVATSLTAALQNAKIPTDEPIVLHVSASGRITTNSAYKERLDKFFQENPELEKQVKEVAALNSMLALNEAMRRFNAASKAAKDDDGRQRAQDTYTADCLRIHSLSGTMTLSGGQLTSAARDYMDATLAAPS